MASIPLSPETLIAIHTHRIVRAKLEEQAARTEARQAMAAARALGICPRVIKRALRKLDPREKALDVKADALLDILHRVPIGCVVVAGALSPDAPQPILTAPDCEATA